MIGVVVLLFVCTRSLVLKPILLPRLSESTNLEWDCRSISYWPTSGLTFKEAVASDSDFRGPVFQCETLSVNSPGFAIFNKEIAIRSLKVSKLQINQVTLKDGRSNLDNFRKSFAYRQPLQNDMRDFRIGEVEIQDSSLTFSSENIDGDWTRVSHTGINLNLNNWRKGENGTFGLKISSEKQVPGNQRFRPGSLKLVSEVNGAFRTSRKGFLNELTLEGSSEPLMADGIFSELNGAAIKLQTQFKDNVLTPARISLLNGGRKLFEISSGGPLNLELKDANQILTYEGNPMVLNTILAGSGLEVSDGKIKGRSTFFVNRGGKAWMTNHDCQLDALRLRHRNQRLPALDGKLNSRIAFDLNGESIRIDKFSASVQSDANNVLTLSNKLPLSIAYGQGNPGFAASTIESSLKLQLEHWRAFIPDDIVSGQLDLTFNATSTNDGKLITWRGSSNPSHVSFRSNINPQSIQRYNVELKSSGPFKDLKVIENGSLNLSFFDPANGALLGTANCDLLYLGEEDGVNFMFNVDSEDLSHLATMVHIPVLSDVKGKAGIHVNFSKLEKGVEKVNCTLLAEQIFARYKNQSIENMRFETGFRVDMTEDNYQVQSALMNVRFGPRSALSASGNFMENFAQQRLSGEIKILSMNHDIVRILQPPWLNGLEMSDLAVKGNIKLDSRTGWNGLSILPNLTIERMRPRGFSGSLAASLKAGISGTTTLNGDRLIASDWALNFSPDDRSNRFNNFLKLVNPVEVTWHGLKQGMQLNAPRHIVLHSDQLNAVSWVELIKFWNLKNMESSTSSSTLENGKSFSAPVRISLAMDKFFDGTRTIEGWKREASLSAWPDFPISLARLVPPVQ